MFRWDFVGKLLWLRCCLAGQLLQCPIHVENRFEYPHVSLRMINAAPSSLC